MSGMSERPDAAAGGPSIPDKLRQRYRWLKTHSALEGTPGAFIEMQATDRIGFIADITRILSEANGNVSYLQTWSDPDGTSHTLIQVDDEALLRNILEKLRNVSDVGNVEIRPSHRRTFGKRIIVIGGGAQVAQVASGAIAEADRHTIRGEAISVDTMPVVGEPELAEAVLGAGRLHRVGIVVLAGAIMGGDISRAVTALRADYGIPVMSLKMVGSVNDVSDLVVSDPLEAGVMAVMLISHIGKFDLMRIHGRRI